MLGIWTRLAKTPKRFQEILPAAVAWFARLPGSRKAVSLERRRSCANLNVRTKFGGRNGARGHESEPNFNRWCLAIASTRSSATWV